MKSDNVFIIIISLLFSTVDLCYSSPTVEGLLRNNSNLDHEIKVFSVSMLQQESELEREEYLIVFSDQSPDAPKVYISRRGTEKARQWSLI